MYRPLWIEIDLDRLDKNYKIIKKIVGKTTKILATIKQNAYGHGIVPVAKRLTELGVDFFGVGSLEEAITLRENKINKPILVLSAHPSDTSGVFLDYRVIPTIVDYAFAKNLNKEAKKRGIIVPVHIKVDTGMGRLGPWYEDAFKFICNLKELKNLFLEGLFTHFPAADTDPEFTKHQLKVFNELITRLRRRGIIFRYTHCANSAGILFYREAHFNLVRPGLILYGIKPHPRLNLKLFPLLSLKSKVIFLKKFPRGRSISYGRTYITKRSTFIATVAIGYADGYPWSLSDQGKVIIENNYCKVRGRVCMDHIMVDVGRNKNVKVGSEVTLIGERGNLKITAEDLARWANTIPYEIVSRLSLKIPRIYK